MTSTPTRSLPQFPKELTDRLARRVVATSGETSTALAPYTGQTLATLPVSTVADVATAFERAREAQRGWAATPLRRRASILLAVHDMVLDRQAEVLDLIQWESGKARKHAFEEVADVAVTARYYARRGPTHLRPRRRSGIFPGLTVAYELRQPKGVVGLISPWNYPLTLGVSDALPALLAGNAVVHKPDAQTSLTALWGVELLHEAGLPEGVWQVVYGDGPAIGGAILDLADYVCFTGSTRTGREVAQRCAARLVGCSLELGGKNPLLVLADADLDRAAEGAVRACFSSAGQLCVSIERLYVAAAVREELMARFLDRVRAMRLAASFGYDADMGSLTSAQQLDTVAGHVADAVAKGARVLAGGRARPDLGPYFYEPTVLADVTETMVCHGEETFGPVVSVYPFAAEADAVRLANQTPYGLNASVWTRDAVRGRRVAGQIRAGTVNVNEAYGAAWGSVDAPMGGMGESGLGRRHGAEGVTKYTEAQTVATQRVQGFGTPPWTSDERWVGLLTGSLKVMKALGRR
ncbi:MAG TPA: succinic semialdehyde dehydrogenase [Mycobacteriales bacterium]|nr:succinic semialdehyde dehydrogenase [Mycobacteriales bacterium]